MACFQHRAAGSLMHTLRSAAGSRGGRCKGTSSPSGSAYLKGHRAAAALAECRYRGAASSRRLGSKVWSHAGSMGPPAAEVDPPDRRCVSLFSSKYDREILSVALPALMAMLLEPAMAAVNSGECLALQCPSGYVWLGLCSSQWSDLEWSDLDATASPLGHVTCKTYKYLPPRAFLFVYCPILLVHTLMSRWCMLPLCAISPGRAASRHSAAGRSQCRVAGRHLLHVPLLLPSLLDDAGDSRSSGTEGPRQG